MPKAREESWAYLIPLPWLSVIKAVWHTRTGDHAGEKVALLAQLKLPLATRSNDIPPDKRILLPAPHAPHALPCAPDGGTDVPWSQYSTPATMKASVPRANMPRISRMNARVHACERLLPFSGCVWFCRLCHSIESGPFNVLCVSSFLLPLSRDGFQHRPNGLGQQESRLLDLLRGGPAPKGKSKCSKRSRALYPHCKQHL